MWSGGATSTGRSGCASAKATIVEGGPQRRAKPGAAWVNPTSDARMPAGSLTSAPIPAAPGAANACCALGPRRRTSAAPSGAPAVAVLANARANARPGTARRRGRPIVRSGYRQRSASAATTTRPSAMNASAIQPSEMRRSGTELDTGADDGGALALGESMAASYARGPDPDEGAPTL